MIFSIWQFKKKPEFFYITIGYLIPAVYLVWFVKEGGTYITLYAHSINWIPLLGLLLYAEFQLGSLILTLLVIANLYLNQSRIIGVAPNEPWLTYNAMSLLQKRVTPNIPAQEYMKKLIQNSAHNIKTDQIRILLVYPAPAAFSTFDPKYDITYMFDQSVVPFDKPFHYIILSLNSSLFDTKKIDKMTTLDDDNTKKILKNHELLAHLMKYKKLNAENCILLYQKEKTLLFQCKNT